MVEILIAIIYLVNYKNQSYLTKIYLALTGPTNIKYVNYAFLRTGMKIDKFGRQGLNKLNNSCQGRGAIGVVNSNNFSRVKCRGGIFYGAYGNIRDPQH